MTKPAFANLRFGDWSRILVGQINRRHYYFAVEGKQVRGFIGWALTTEDKAEAWVQGRHGLTYENSKAGDCLVFNAWAADSTRVHRFLVDDGAQDRREQAPYFLQTPLPGRHHTADAAERQRFREHHIGRKASAAKETAGSDLGIEMAE